MPHPHDSGPGARMNRCEEIGHLLSSDGHCVHCSYIDPEWRAAYLKVAKDAKNEAKTFEIHREGGAFRWPDDQPLPEGTKDGERRFQMEQEPGGWARLCKVRGLAVITTAVEDCVTHKASSTYRVLGDRTLLSFRASGYELEGRVSVNGRKCSAFTGSVLIVKKDVDGKDRLYNLAVLHVRNRPGSVKAP